VLVTHDSEVGDACDRVIKMRDGRIRDHGLHAATPVVGVQATAATA
jgi:ABC-type lipoprotein export system ATPase subunit